MSFSLASFRLRILFRAAFLLLALATVAMTLMMLQEEKRLGYRNYQSVFNKTRVEISSKLNHPSGQLALLNPAIGSASVTPLHPLLLPFAALDFDDRHKVQQAIEMAGCRVTYANGDSLCVAVGNNPWAGGFIYVVGSFVATSLVEHAIGDEDLAGAHRVRVSVSLRGETERWLAPFEAMPNAPRGLSAHGRLTGYVENQSGTYRGKPVRDFRGWVWQQAQCRDADAAQANADCPRRVFYSMRLPVETLRAALFAGSAPVWPPADLNRIETHIQVLAPRTGAVLFDSNAAEAVAPFSLSDLKSLLLPGETLSIYALPRSGQAPLIRLTGGENGEPFSSRLLAGVIRRLPVEGYDAPIQSQETISTASGKYEVLLKGDIGGVNRSLVARAARLSWFALAMLLAVALTWLAIELGVVRRMTMLNRRAIQVSRSVRGNGSFDDLDLTDLRSGDELGLLAKCLADLLQRVREDVARQHIRAEQEKEMWHAVGHEIMSPLQSLMAMHGRNDDPSLRYIQRMQQAVRILYGSASPSEAFQASTLQDQEIDLRAFLRTVASNAPCAGIAQVEFADGGEAVRVRADDYSLEDVVTHVLRNADRHRTPGTPITLDMQASETRATVTIRNRGPRIPEDLIDKIFEYGVSGQHETEDGSGNRGQGLFVARTYMAKMGGTITARNEDDGVSFMLTLTRVAA